MEVGRVPKILATLGRPWRVGRGWPPETRSSSTC